MVDELFFLTLTKSHMTSYITKVSRIYGVVNDLITLLSRRDKIPLKETFSPFVSKGLRLQVP